MDEVTRTFRGLQFDGTWAHGKRQGRGVTKATDGTCLEACYHEDTIIGALRIFYPVLRQCPSDTQIVQRFFGAPLSATMKEIDRPVRLSLQPVPSWLRNTKSISNDLLPGGSQPLVQVLSWLKVVKESTGRTFCCWLTPGLAKQPAGVRAVSVSLVLRAVSLTTTSLTSTWSCAAELQVAPFLDWDEQELSSH